MCADDKCAQFAFKYQIEKCTIKNPNVCQRKFSFMIIMHKTNVKKSSVFMKTRSKYFKKDKYAQVSFR